MKRFWTITIAAILAASVVVFAVTGFAQTNASATNTPGGPPFRVQANLVNVPVAVTDDKGAPVHGLERHDFILTEDGRPETIRLFQANSARPLSIVLAIDTSLSVHKDLDTARRAAYDFSHSLLRRGDQLQLMGFAGEVKEITPFTDNLRTIDKGLHLLHGGGPTALYAAVTRAAENLQSLPGRKVIVIISDGANSVAGASYEQARRAALQAQAGIESIILVPIAASAGRDLGGEHTLIQLSHDTGGEYFYVYGPGALPGELARLSGALRAEYLLGYYPQPTQRKDGHRETRFRRIQVRMANPVFDPKYHLHYRTGYYVQAGR